MFTKLFAGVMLQREAGNFQSTATSAQRRRYNRLVSQGWSDRQAIGIVRGTYRTR